MAESRRRAIITENPLADKNQPHIPCDCGKGHLIRQMKGLKIFFACTDNDCQEQMTQKEARDRWQETGAWSIGPLGNRNHKSDIEPFDYFGV